MRQKTVYAFLFFQVFFGTISAADDSFFSGATAADNGFTSTIINVGQGNGIQIFDNQNGRMMIVDAGSSCLPNKQTSDSIIPTFFTHFPQKISLAPVTIVVSHPDKDHLNWIKRIIDSSSLITNPNMTVYLGGNFEKYLISSEAKKLLAALLKPKVAISIHSLSHSLTISEMLTLYNQGEKYRAQYTNDQALGYENEGSAVIQTIRDKDGIAQKIRPFIVKSKMEGFDDINRVTVEILGANAGHTPTKVYLLNNADSFFNDNDCLGGEIVNPDENTNSIVLRVTFYNAKSIIITGDATGITTDRLIKNYPKNNNITHLNCDLLIACHHGSITEESNNPSWVQSTQPKWVIFSAGKYDSYHHPQFDAVWNYAGSERLEKAAKHPIFCARINTRKLPSVKLAQNRGIDTSKTILAGVPGEQQWLDNILCELGIYSTHSSGTIVFNVTSKGEMTLKVEK